MRRTSLCLLALLVLAGCRTAPDDELSRPTEVRTVHPSGVATPLPARLAAGVPVPADTLVWASGSRLHVGSTTLDVSPLRVSGLAQTAGGLYVVGNGRLWSTDLKTLHDTGLDATRGFQVSPDGRYLGFVDHTHGVKDAFHTPMATVVVYDTSTGARVVDSTLGMGDPAKDDFTDLYLDAEPQLLGYADGRIIVDTPDGTYAEPLNGSAPVRYSNDPSVIEGATQIGLPTSATRQGDHFVIHPGDGSTTLLGPGRRYGVVDEEGVNRWTPIDGTGRVLKVAGLPDKLDVGPWFSDGGFFAIAERGDHDRPVGIVRCDLAAGRCRTLVPRSGLGASPVLSSLTPGER